MAYGSFAPLYTKVEQDLIEMGQRLTFEVLRGLAWHVNELGIARIRPSTIARKLRRSPSTVEAQLEFLLDQEYICRHIVKNEFERGRDDVYFQIRPDAIYIREDLESEAWRLWDSCNLGVTTVIKDETPESHQNQNPESPESDSRITQTPPPKSTVENGEGRRRGAGRDYANRTSANGTAKTNGHRKTHTAQSAKPKQQREAQEPPLPPVPARPLSPDEEALASRIAEFGTRENQARDLVLRYGCVHVETGLTWLNFELEKAQQRKRSRIENPVGLFTAWLRRNYISPDDLPPAGAENAYASGEDSSWINR